MKRKFIALATVLIILCTFTAQAFAATSPETNAYTYEEYYAAIQECFASYGIVWEGVLKHRPLENFERALQTAFLESIISTSTATAPIGSFKAPKTGFAATSKPEINLAALRNGGKVDMKMY